MLVKAKWHVADASGWHSAGEVFDTKEDLGNAVEVLVNTMKPAETAADVNVQEQEEPKRPVRRKTASK